MYGSDDALELTSVLALKASPKYFRPRRPAIDHEVYENDDLACELRLGPRPTLHFFHSQTPLLLFLMHLHRTSLDELYAAFCDVLSRHNDAATGGGMLLLDVFPCVECKTLMRGRFMDSLTVPPGEELRDKCPSCVRIFDF